WTAVDNIPNTTMPYGMYRVTISDNSDSKYAATAEDVTITPTRITELDISPHPLPAGTAATFSVAVQSQTITSVTANVNIYSQDANGVVTTNVISGPMNVSSSGDRYEYSLVASILKSGDKIVASA